MGSSRKAERVRELQKYFGKKRFSVWARASLLLVGGMGAGRSEMSALQETRPGPAASPASIPPLVFKGVTVIDVQAGRRLTDQVVIVAGNRIQAMGANGRVPLPAGSRVVEAGGKYLIPGLWDMHVHPQEYVDVAYPMFIANGITGVRDAGSDVPLATFGRWKSEIAAGSRVGPRLIVSGQSIDGTRLVTQKAVPGKKAPDALNQPSKPERSDRCSAGVPFHVCAATPAEARLLVDFFKIAGADMIKAYSLPRELHLAVAAEAKRVGIPFGGHSWNVPGLEISDSGELILDHQPWLNPNLCGEPSDAVVPVAVDAEQCAAAGKHLRQNGTWVMFNTPGGLVDMRQYDRELRLRYLPAKFAKAREVLSKQQHAPPGPMPGSTTAWKALLSSKNAPTIGVRVTDTALINRAQNYSRWLLEYFPILAGTDATIQPMDPFSGDAIPGFSLHSVLLAYVLDGMTPLDALRTATLNPALALQATDSLGTVETGKLADLVLLDADPLEDITNTTKIRAVVANGRYYDRAVLEKLLDAAYQAALRTH